MGDFLNNFNKENYQETLAEKDCKSKHSINNDKNEAQDMPKRSDVVHGSNEKKIENAPNRNRSEQTEIDPDYQEKLHQKKRILSFLLVLLVILLAMVYYFIAYVPMANFENKQLSYARTWAASNKMTLDIEQKYSNKVDANSIIKQQFKKGKRVKKGRKIKIIASKGANPNEKIKLPDFSKMSESEASKWVKSNKAENISVTSEYHDSLEKGKFIKQEITNPEIDSNNYRRKDKMLVYYSKGKEIFRKDITMPDFVNKSKSEVEAWAKKNDIQMTYETVDSSEIISDSIVSQSITAGEKIAKKTELTVRVSLGKATIIPSFAELSKEQAQTVEGLNVIVKEQFSNDVPYGGLLSQSVEPDTKITSKDSNQVTVVYSAGKPYLKNLCGNGTTEGDLQKIFYDEYISKGANIQYKTYYVDSAEAKGTVVEMSTMGEYIPMNYTVSIGISNGNG